MFPSYNANPNPNLYFSTAAGPDVSDLVGPPLGVLDVYGDGTPLARAQAPSMAHGSGGSTPFYRRADVQSFAVLLLGAWMIHRYARG